MVYKFVRSHQKHVAAAALALITILRSSERPKIPSPRWIVWNVGQGSWLTRIENGRCHHFDAGGEGRFPYQIVRLCRDLENTIAISHSDWDHISFVSRLRSEVPKLCRQGPYDKIVSGELAKIPQCKNTHWWTWRPKIKSKKRNDLSSVYFHKGLLYPGDSPKKFEKYWKDRIPGQVAILVLAHHGSKTGTSAKLLKQESIKQTVVSARAKKYGHPHPSVVSLLKKFRIPLLRTEVWGSIHFLD